MFWSAESKTYMKEKHKILVLINQQRLRHTLLREIEAEADLFHADRFVDIIAEIKWQELDAIIIDMNDPDIDGIGIIQTINSTCPSASVLLLSEETDNTLDQIQGLLVNASLVTGKINGRLLADRVRYEIKRTQRERTRPENAGEIITMQIDEAFGKAIEKLIVALMGVNHQAAEFQINRDSLTWDAIQKIECFAGELERVTQSCLDTAATEQEKEVENRIC